MSIQTRLTLSFTGLFGIILLGLAGGSYVLVRASLFSDLNVELQVAVDGTAMSARHEMNEHSNPAGGEADLQEVLSGRDDVALPDTAILVRQGDRVAAYRAAQHGAIDLRKVPADDLTSKTSTDLRIAFRDLPVPKFNSHYEIYAAAPIAPVKSKLTSLAVVLVLLVPVGLAFAASAGYALAKKSLRPLHNLSATIDRVTSSDMSVRVPASDGNDEISKIGQRFNSLLNRLQQSFDSQQRFMADASHELRTPVTVALATAQVTGRDPFRSQEDSDEALRVIETQMLRVKNIVQQLLLLSQADASSLKLNMDDVYLDDVVAEAARSARALAMMKHQHLDVLPLPEARIHADSDLLGQALMILLDNAVKFTPPGGSVEIGITKSQENWVCHVSDTGAGIAESAQERIFDRFYRAATTVHTGTEVPGSGLGLAIAKVIIESQQGSLVLVESRPGYTRFEMRLPALSSEGENEGAEHHQANSLPVRI